MKRINFLLVSFVILFITTNCTKSANQEISTLEGSVFWSPYHNDGNEWVGPIVYYLYSDSECFVRAGGINNRVGGERIGRVEKWAKNGDSITIEGHKFKNIGNQLLVSKNRVFFKASNLSEAYNIIYLQSVNNY